MTTVVLTTASTSPWAVPLNFIVAGHTVALVGSGGNGGAGTTGTSGTAGGGGGGGACTVCTYSSGTITPGTTTIPFLINTGGSANATQWQSSTAGVGNYYEALPGGNGAAAGTAGTAGGNTTVVGAPTITYTRVNATGGVGGTGGGSNSLGGGGGGGAGGPLFAGGQGGSPVTSTATGGGGGGGGGASGAGGNGSGSTGGLGGQGSTGTGGAGGATGGTGTGSSGGGGGNGGAASVGGPGGSGTDFQVSPAAGPGGGGGGSGGKTTTGTVNLTGGNGGSFGGGGGGTGCLRTAGGTITVGTGGSGGIVISTTTFPFLNLAAIALTTWQPFDWPYDFNRGLQPYGNGYVTVAAQPVANNPPFTNRDRTQTIVSEIVALNQPTDWPYVYNRGGRQPYENGKLAALSTSILNSPPVTSGQRGPFETWGWGAPTVTDVEVGRLIAPPDNPRFGHPERTPAIISAIVAANQPPDWPYAFVGGAQPYSPRVVPQPLIPSRPFAPVWLNQVLATWQPPDPLPTLPRNLAALSTSVVNNPPFIGTSKATAVASLSAWVPPDPLPTLPRNLVPQPPAANNPPFGYRPFNWGWGAPNVTGIFGGALVQSAAVGQPYWRDTSSIVTTWQPPDPLPTLPRYLAALSTSVVNNPPPNADILANTIVIIAQQQPDWPYVYQRGGWQPYVQGNRPVYGLSVDNPPVIGTSRATAVATQIAWVPPDPQPTLPGLTNPAIPGRSVDQPPGIRVTVVIPPVDFTLPQQQRYLTPVQAFVQPPFVAQQVGTVLQWQPVDPQPTLPRNLAALSTSVVNNPPLLRRIILPVPEDAFALQPRLGVPPQVVVQPFTPWWLNPILAWQPVDPLPTLPRNLAALATSIINNPPVRGTGQPTLGSILSTAWLPPDPLPQVAPKFIFGVTVNNPPFGVKPFGWSFADPKITNIFGGALVQSFVASATVPYRTDFSAILAAWQPPDPLPTLAYKLPSILLDDSTPFGSLVPTVVTVDDLPLPQATKFFVQPFVAPVVNNPPFGQNRFTWAYGAPNVTGVYTGGLVQPFVAAQQPYRSDLSPILAAWQLPDPSPQFSRYLVQPFTATQQPYSRDLSSILTTWQPPDWLSQSRLLLAALSTSTVNNPPLRQPQAAPGVWPPPDVPPQLGTKLPPSLIAVRVDNPPFIIQARYANILTAWEPPPPQPVLNAHLLFPGPVVVVTDIHNLPFFVTVGKLKAF